MTTGNGSGRRFLIWGLCIGRKCRALAPLWLNSLIHSGWKHDIVLLGDRRIESLSHPQLRTIEIVSDMERLNSFPRRHWNPYVCHNWKPQIQFYVDLSKYDYVLYLDLDVLVNTDRLEPLLDSKAARGKICVQRDTIPISRDKFFTGRYTLTAEEKVRWGHHAICAGIVSFPTTTIGLRFIRDWHEVNQRGQFRKNDQSNLIALLLRHYEGSWEYLGDTVIARKQDRYEETLLHFSGQRHELLRKYYRHTLGLKEPEVLKRMYLRWTGEMFFKADRLTKWTRYQAANIFASVRGRR